MSSSHNGFGQKPSRTRSHDNTFYNTLEKVSSFLVYYVFINQTNGHHSLVNKHRFTVIMFCLNFYKSIIISLNFIPKVNPFNTKYHQNN